MRTHFGTNTVAETASLQITEMKQLLSTNIFVEEILTQGLVVLLHRV